MSPSTADRLIPGWTCGITVQPALSGATGGSGPAQLALAILADHLGDDEQALNLYQRFKWAVIAELPKVSVDADRRQIEPPFKHIRATEASRKG